MPRKKRQRSPPEARCCVAKRRMRNSLKGCYRFASRPQIPCDQNRGEVVGIKPSAFLEGVARGKHTRLDNVSRQGRGGRPPPPLRAKGVRAARGPSPTRRSS